MSYAYVRRMSIYICMICISIYNYIYIIYMYSHEHTHPRPHARAHPPHGRFRKEGSLTSPLGFTRSRHR